MQKNPLALAVIARLCPTLRTDVGVSVDSAVFARLCAALKSDPYHGALLAAEAGPAAATPPRRSAVAPAQAHARENLRHPLKIAMETSRSVRARTRRDP
jgi:ribosomal protein L12E/L44/L45/RPP1/RPP2